MEWQKIETAPKDGTPVLLFGVSNADRQMYWDIPDKIKKVFLGWFANPNETFPSGKEWVTTDVVYEFWDYGGQTGAGTSDERVTVSPTHWMPLPSPPTGE